jgi:hypothetical protein
MVVLLESLGVSREREGREPKREGKAQTCSRVEEAKKAQENQGKSSRAATTTTIVECTMHCYIYNTV